MGRIEIGGNRAGRAGFWVLAGLGLALGLGGCSDSISNSASRYHLMANNEDSTNKMPQVIGGEASNPPGAATQTHKLADKQLIR